jgi:hypothetical protein
VVASKLTRLKTTQNNSNVSISNVGAMGQIKAMVFQQTIDSQYKKTSVLLLIPREKADTPSGNGHQTRERPVLLAKV